MRAGFCRAGTESWFDGMIVDLHDDALWAVTKAPHVPGAIYLCWFEVGEHEVHLALRRGRDPLRFDLLQGAKDSLGGALKH